MKYLQNLTVSFGIICMCLSSILAAEAHYDTSMSVFCVGVMSFISTLLLPEE